MQGSGHTGLNVTMLNSYTIARTSKDQQCWVANFTSFFTTVTRAIGGTVVDSSRHIVNRDHVHTPSFELAAQISTQQPLKDRPTRLPHHSPQPPPSRAPYALTSQSPSDYNPEPPSGKSLLPDTATHWTDRRPMFGRVSIRSTERSNCG